MKNFEFATPLVPTVSLAILTVLGRWRERRHAGTLHCSRGRWYVLFDGHHCHGSCSARRSWFCGGFLRRRTNLKQKICRLKLISLKNEGITHNNIHGSHRCRRHESVEILDGPPSHFGRNWPTPCLYFTNNMVTWWKKKYVVFDLDQLSSGARNPTNTSLYRGMCTWQPFVVRPVVTAIPGWWRRRKEVIVICFIDRYRMCRYPICYEYKILSYISINIFIMMYFHNAILDVARQYTINT